MTRYCAITVTLVLSRITFINWSRALTRIYYDVRTSGRMTLYHRGLVLRLRAGSRGKCVLVSTRIFASSTRRRRTTRVGLGTRGVTPRHGPWRPSIRELISTGPCIPPPDRYKNNPVYPPSSRYLVDKLDSTRQNYFRRFSFFLNAFFNTLSFIFR